MTDVERVERALERALAWDVEGDVLACELTHEERCTVAQTIITAVEPAIWNAAIEAAAEAAEPYDCICDVRNDILALKKGTGDAA